MACCAIAPDGCDRSVRQGGAGCYLCDTVALLPQQDYRDRIKRKKVDDVREGDHLPGVSRRSKGCDMAPRRV